MTLSGQEVPSGYVYVHPRADMCGHLHVSGDDRAKSARQPLLSPCCLCFTLQTVLCQNSSFCEPHGSQMYLTCPALKRWCGQRIARQGHCWKKWWLLEPETYPQHRETRAGMPDKEKERKELQPNVSNAKMRQGKVVVLTYAFAYLWQRRTRWWQYQKCKKDVHISLGTYFGWKSISKGWMLTLLIRFSLVYFHESMNITKGQ